MNTAGTPRVPEILDLHAYLGEFNPFALKPLSDAWVAAGLRWMIGVGNDVATSEAAVDAAWSLPDTIAGVGLHPSRIPTNGAGSADQLEELGSIADLATDPQVGVISDAGVDDTADAPRELQEDVFKALLDVAVANGRSILVHWNAPVARLVEIWDGLPSGPPRAAILTFTGDAAEAQELVDRNFYFSISPDAVGISQQATFPAEVLRELPAERLFIHSSARPGDGDTAVGPPIVHDVLVRLAAARAVEPEAMAAQINTNLWEFLAWRPK